MKINEKRIVVSSTPNGLFGKNTNIPKIKILECVEERPSKGEFTGKEGIGYIFKDSEGLLYGFNYPRIHEGFSNNVFVRYIPDDEYLKLTEEEKDKAIDFHVWFDITNIFLPEELSCTKELGIVTYCPEHLRYYYNNNEKECEWCKHSLPSKKDGVDTVKGNTSHWYETDLEIS